MLIGIIVIAILLVLVYAWISISNGLNKALVKIDEASSGIDVVLTKRYDVLTKMINVVKVRGIGWWLAMVCVPNLWLKEGLNRFRCYAKSLTNKEIDSLKNLSLFGI